MLLKKVLRLIIILTEAAKFRKIHSLTQVFSCEFSEISKNTFSIEHLQTTASVFNAV